MGRTLTAPTLHEIQQARERISRDVVRTPLVRFEGDPGEPEIFLKLENLQPIGSFKLRGAMNRIRSTSPTELEAGVFTASAGNMAQGVAWAARTLGTHASVVVPDTAPRTKLDAIRRLGADIVKLPYDEWWSTMRNHGRPGMSGVFVHPFADPDVMAGNGTIGLEILEDLEDVDVVLVPWGGGGLACGIASAIRALKPSVRVYACEVEGAAPLSASLIAGEPVTIQNRRTFVDGIGGRGVFQEIWPLARELVVGSFTVSVADTADAVRLLATRNRIVAEGAGAVPLAAARRYAQTIASSGKRVACIVSGGNIDASVLATILSGTTP